MKDPDASKLSPGAVVTTDYGESVVLWLNADTATSTCTDQSGWFNQRETGLVVAVVSNPSHRGSTNDEVLVLSATGALGWCHRTKLRLCS